MRKTITCTLCRREIAVSPNWNLRQAGRLLEEYRVARHSPDERSTTKAGRYVRRPICTGSGIVVRPDQVTVAA